VFVHTHTHTHTHIYIYTFPPFAGAMHIQSDAGIAADPCGRSDEKLTEVWQV